jgi:hypothetical protein
MLTRGADRPALNVFAAVLFAICAHIKFTYFLLALLIIAIAIARCCSERKILPAALLGGGFTTVLLLAWRIPGQHFATLPAYLRMSWEICVGYKEAMGTPANSALVVVLGIAAALLSSAVCLLVFFEAPNWRRVFVPALFGGTIFLSWNRAFVRADDHVLSFFAFCPVALPMIWTAVNPKTSTKRVGFGLTTVVFAICLWGIWIQKPSVISGCIVDTTNRFRGAWRVLTDTPGIKRELDQQLAAAKATYALPHVCAEVGRNSIDVFGYDQGVALLNGLNYTPRLVFQSYSAYTPVLIDANTAFYRSPAAPTYVLMKLEPIDQRYPTLEDAGVLREILYNYTFEFQENGYLLWKRRRLDSAAAPVPAIFDDRGATARANMGDDVALPAAPAIWVEIDVRPSLRGALRAALYKPPEVEIRTVDVAGVMSSHRLVPSMSERGFLISPRLDASDVASASSNLDRNAVVSFSVRAQKPDRRFFRRNFAYRITTLPAFPTSEISRAVSIENVTRTAGRFGASALRAE